MDFQAYVDVLRRRWAFILVCLVLMTGLAGAYSFSRSPVYTAVSEVLVRPLSSVQGLSSNQLVSLDTEARLVTSAPIAAIAKESLQSPLSVQSLLQHVSVETTAETLVLDISYWASSPGSAAAGADAFADAYLEYRRKQAQEDLLNERGALQELIDGSTVERDEQNSILEDSVPGSAEYRNATAQRDTLNGQIAILTAQLAQIPVTLDPGDVILPATAPDAPSSPNHVMNLVLGAFLGGFIGLVGAFVRDRVDDRIRSRADLEVSVNAPILAMIPRVDGWHRRLPGWLVTDRQPGSPGAEAYRTLRTSVMAMSRQRQIKVIAVVGATLGEGKTATTANLASALAHADNRVVAVSADLRKPRLHEFFHLGNEVGLSDLLLGASHVSDVIQQYASNLFVIAGGTIPDRPAELLESEAMANVVDALREQFDFVLIDTPPVLGLADTLAIAPLVDAILLVAHAGTSRSSALFQAQEQLEQMGAKIRGCVLTNVTIGRGSVYRYGYGYSSATGLPHHRAVPGVSRVRRWIAAQPWRTRSVETGSSGSRPEQADAEWRREQVAAAEASGADNGAPRLKRQSGNGSRMVTPSSGNRAASPRQGKGRRPTRRPR